MIKIKNKSECCGCYACYNVCPNDAISMEEDEKGFCYPVIDEKKCINCNLCEKVCPIINNVTEKKKLEAYACINKENNIRLKSSSGGIFTLIAEEILDLEGVVFGAAFNKNFDVEHICITNKKELEKLRGSKYVQSNIGETFKQAKVFLEQDRYVLFTGTPCQVEALKSYLRKDYEKLFTQDFICHGVPSKKVWQKYLEFASNKNKIIKKINFRNKKNGWKKFSLNIEYDKATYNKNHIKDLYMRAFLQNLSLRDSCFDCQFKKYYRNSDITLADFWGVSKLNPKISDDKGTSLVIINSIKGKDLFDKIKDKCLIEKVDLDKAIKYNKSFITSVQYNINRDKFFDDLEIESNFKKLINKYTYRPTFIRKVLKKIKSKVKR